VTGGSEGIWRRPTCGGPVGTDVVWIDVHAWLFCCGIGLDVQALP